MSSSGNPANNAVTSEIVLTRSATMHSIITGSRPDASRPTTQNGRVSLTSPIVHTTKSRTSIKSPALPVTQFQLHNFPIPLCRRVHPCASECIKTWRKCLQTQEKRCNPIPQGE